MKERKRATIYSTAQAPFSHATFQFRIKMPIFIAREWFRHTVGITRNEVSRRYVTDEPEFFTPAEWRSKAEHVKQGSGEAIDAPAKLREITNVYNKAIEKCVKAYETLLNCGVCPEQARMVLPQSMMTEFIETGSLYAYARIWRLRTDPHAQKEIQHYAAQVGEEIKKVCPVSWAALTNVALSSSSQSRTPATHPNSLCSTPRVRLLRAATKYHCDDPAKPHDRDGG